ncbi:MAG: glycosyltransferase [Caldilineaceae bacterium]
MPASASATTRTFATTVSGWDDERFHKQSYPLHRCWIQIPRTVYPMAEVALLLRVLQAALQRKRITSSSSRGYTKPELLATALIGLWPRAFRPQIIFYGEMFEPDEGWRYAVERLLMQLASRHLPLCRPLRGRDPCFTQLWSISPSKMRATGFFTKRATETPVRRARRRQPHRARWYLFSKITGTPRRPHGGSMPTCRFVICTNRLDGRQDIPANVRLGLVAPDEYDELLGTAAAVVVPLRKDVHRITGMLTYVQAMWAKQPVIVTDTLGVREYVTDGETGLLVDGSPQSYVTAIRRVLDPQQSAWVDEMCERAHTMVCEKFTVARHVDQLLAVVDEAFTAEEGARTPIRQRFGVNQ